MREKFWNEYHLQNTNGPYIIRFNELDGACERQGFQA